MATLNGFVFNNEAVPLEAIHHLRKAVGLVNHKLGTLEALSNSNISVVNFMLIQGMYREDHLSAEIHWNGLRKIIKLRGCLLQLEDDHTLALKICK